MFDNLPERQVELLFKRLLSKEENTRCADCKQKGATWASLGFGVFVCISCSGIHRSFGMHITRVRSTKLDSWTKADAKIMEIVGNQIANMYWEHKIIYHKKDKISFENDKKNFIWNKYDLKTYCKSNVENPVDYIVNNHYNTTSQALKNLYSPSKTQKQKEKSQPLKNFDFIKNSANKNKQNLNQNSNSDLIDINFLEMKQENQIQTIVQKNKNQSHDLLSMDFITDQKQSIPQSKTTGFDFDFLGDQNNQQNQQKNSTDFDFTSNTNQNPNFNFNNQVGFSNNIINIQNYNVFNTNNQVNQQHNQELNGDKYQAFDVFHRTQGYF